ncbi:hypothetical protein M4578_09875 [Salipiger sp. P9]|uniref:hypothetical protein n=1 Tax=Salipiger pentaromativorans TaxID=2943193 RepID=UPI002158560D|nr:hypothetical protein [Salipiger pentaromativorans]MCR8548138.1 hypothetical protein [Salipiger pentaromativorans]
MHDTEILARVRATGARRVIGVGTLGLLGALLLWLAVAEPPATVLWQGFLILLGAAALWLAQVMWRSTGRELLLTEEALCDSTGAVLARIDEIARVDRSMFAMKPSNGFLIQLRTPGTAAWQPGLWWRLGRRVAVGGVTAGRDTKPLADALSLLVARRDGALPPQ